MDKLRRRMAGAYGALLIGNFAMALNPWMVRMADVSPIASGFWRLMLAVPLTFVLTRMFRQPIPRMPGRIIAILVVGGVLFAADLAAWHVGIMRTKMGNAALLGNLASFMLAGYYLVLSGRRPTGRQGLAMMLAACGAILLVGQSYELSSHYMVGDLCCILAGIFYTGFIAAMNRARATLEPMPALFVSTFAGAPPLLAFAMLEGGPIWPSNWWPLIVLAAGCQVAGQGMMVYAMGYLPPLAIALGLLIQPLFAMVIGNVRFGEAIGLADLAGAIAIGTAILLIRAGGPKLPAHDTVKPMESV